ncbi:MAG: TonB-dependent receptor [Bacteroidales bacterium]|nr:TonB-dependent receptor [Bacteroidales bacterium]
MKVRTLILIFFFISSPFAGSQEEYIISPDYQGLSFEEFVTRIEAYHPVRFFFNEEWIKGLKLPQFDRNIHLTDLLDTLLTGTSLYYYLDEAWNVVLTKDFAVRITGKPEPEERKYIPGDDYTGIVEEAGTAGNLVMNIGNQADRNKPGNAIISGYISNLNTREPVAGATVVIRELSVGTISNEFGFYTLAVPRGSYTVRVSFLGMKERLIDVNLYGSGEMNIEMKSTLIPLKETVVTAEKNVILRRFEVGVEKINIVSFRLLPTSMGEADIIKSILLIPGVQSVGEGSSGFNVRGGTSDQNLILLYGAPVYNPSHFFGFFSSVNSDIIREVTLYKGGIPSRYGGRISSVLDISPRDGNRREFAGNAGISPVTTHVVIEGPIKEDTCFYLLSARTTYSNWILGLMENKALRNSRASFYDINGRIAYDINRKNKIDFSGYFSNDGFRFNSDTIYRYHNNIFAFKWRHFFSSRFFSGVNLNNSYYDYRISSDKTPGEAFMLSHRINSTELKADINWYQGSRNEFNFGINLTRYEVLPGSFRPAGDSSMVKPDIIQKQRALESALYFEDKFIVTDHLSANAGLRFSTYFAFGPQSFYIYNDAYPKSSSSVTDTLHFGRSENYRTYAAPEFRLSLNYRLNDNSSFKLNYNRTKQYLHLLSNTTSISPSDTWKLSDYYLKPQVGDQFAIGYYRMLNRKKIEASAEIYYKMIDNLVDFKGGTKLVMNKYIERDLINVEGRAYGVELLFKKQEGRFRWSIGYTYSRILTRTTSNLREERINSGKWFPANFDKPHDLVLTFNYLYSRRFSLSANYTYSSGRPITYPVAAYKVGNIVLTYFSERNKYRIPYYSRLDLSMKISGNLKSKKIAHPHWIFSLYNVLGRQNIYSEYFKYEKNKVQGYMLSVFGRPIPSVSFNFDF